MRADHLQKGAAELREVRRRSRWLYWVVAGFSLMANLLMLTGPIYMLQVYDRVIVSGSVATLVALTGLMVALYLMMGFFDLLRGRIMTRVAIRFHADLQERVFHAVLRKAAVLPAQVTGQGLGDLEAVRRLIAAPIVVAVFDLPWVPIFFFVIFVFHPLLGLLALGGALVLVAITLANQLLTRRGGDAGAHAAAEAQALADAVQRDAQTVRALGMSGTTFGLWQARAGAGMAHELSVANVADGFASGGKMLRLMLQSAMLGLGAWLVMRGQMTAGGMMAGSILLGRALSPIEALLNQWPVARSGLQGWRRLADLLGDVPEEPERVTLPPSEGHLRIDGLSVVPPGQRKPTLRSVTFAIKAGQSVGVIGASGAGKSTLARAVVGAWPVASGSVRLDGAALAQYGADDLGARIGYLPQTVRLFDGTLAQNIARMAAEPDEEAVIEAARQAGAHDLILSLPEGYDTRVQAGEPSLSGGQVQRIGLARAFYGNPALMVLDEPNANLDGAGSAALNLAVRNAKARGRSVLIMTHRPAAIKECDMILVLEGGMRQSFGPRDEVLSGMVRNAGAIRAVPAEAAGMR